MKTNYGKLGRAVMSRLESTSGQAEAVQKQLLACLMHHNQYTVYGRKYGFGRITSARDFQAKVPVSSYNSYENYISRIINGEENILSADQAVYFCASSGTTGEPKYLPLTEADLEIQYLYAYGAVFGMVNEYYRDLPETDVFGKIFQIGEFARTYMENGKMNGIRSGAVYQWLDRDGQFDASDYCVPKEILFPDTLEDLLYAKVRFALAEPKLSAIHGVFINRVAGVMDYIWRNWDMLLYDMEHGSIDKSIMLDKRWCRLIREKLPPSPLRAGELRRLTYSRLRHGMLKKIWPEIRYVLAIGGKAFSYYTDRMKEYAGDVPVHHYAYAASEGIFGIAEKINQPDCYILFPEAGFFEFIPIGDGTDENVKPCFMWELSKGKRYSLLFTNHSGLYRYNMGDVIEVTGWHRQAPVVRFCYRKDQVINVAGEKSNQEQLDKAVDMFVQKTGAVITGYCVQEDFTGILPGYLFYIECAGKTCDSAGQVLDECLCHVNYGYMGCRKMNETGALRIKYLREGSFKKYEKYLAGKGRQMGQQKRVCILDTEEKKNFFSQMCRDS